MFVYQSILVKTIFVDFYVFYGILFKS